MVDNKYKQKEFSDDEINSIRDGFIHDNFTYRYLADAYDCDIKTISRIVNLKSYKYVRVSDDYRELLKQRLS